MDFPSLPPVPAWIGAPGVLRHLAGWAPVQLSPAPDNNDKQVSEMEALLGT